MKWLVNFPVSMIFLLLGTVSFAQDTTYFSEFQLAKIEFDKISKKLANNSVLIDRAVAANLDQIEGFQSHQNPKITPVDWLQLYHTKNLASETNLAGETNKLSEKLFDYLNDQTFKNDVFTIPIGIIDFKAIKINSQSFKNGELFYQDGWEVSKKLLDLNGGAELPLNHRNAPKGIKNVFMDRRYFLAAPLYDLEISESAVRFVLDDQFIFEEDRKVKHVVLTYAGRSYTIKRGAFLDLKLEAGQNEFKLEVFFTNNKSSVSSVQLLTNIDANTKDLASVIDEALLFTGGRHTYIGFDEPSSVQQQLRYGIIWGDCNNTGKIRKPIIMVHGYRPFVQPMNPGLGKLYQQKFNFKGSQYGYGDEDGFVNLLVDNGYDVIICRIDPGFLSIRTGGRLLKSFLKNVVEPQKNAIGSKYETLVLGFSMGAQYWRYCLMEMEKEHLDGNGANHHVRMWLPIDSPNEGANNPLAHQFAAQSMFNNPAGLISSLGIAYLNMLTIGSQEQMRYDMYGTNGTDGASHRYHSARTAYLNDMRNNFYLNGGLTKYRGYPSSTRNVAVSVGSKDQDFYSGLPTGTPTYEENSAFYAFLYTKRWDVLLNSARYISSSLPYPFNSPKKVFHRKVTRQLLLSNSINVLVDDDFYQNNWLELDNAFGSYINDIRDNVNFALRVNSVFGATDYVYQGNQVFVPTVSALGINSSYWPNSLRYNLVTEKLLYDELQDDINNPAHSNDFGYPHIGRPNDYQVLTPMNAVFCDARNFRHIDLVGEFFDLGLSVIYYDQSKLIDFLLNEVEPWYLDLQNQNLGEYARNNFVYKAKYDAKHMIRTGYNLSPKTPFGDYNVRPNVDLDLQSGEIIEFREGTHFQQGTTVHAWIGSLCQLADNPGLVQQGGPTEIYNENKSLRMAELDPTVDFLLYPNPNDGNFTIKGNLLGGQPAELELYNLQGVLVEKLTINHNEPVRLAGNHKGLFIAKIIQNNSVLKETKISVF